MLTWSEFYNQFSIQLNEQQQSAVQSVTGPVLLLAVPGSGKTTVLVTRLGYMIFCRGIAPEKILTVTYTVAATKDMSERFANRFGQDLADRLEFRTINGICARVIQYYGRKTALLFRFSRMRNGFPRFCLQSIRKRSGFIRRKAIWRMSEPWSRT